MNDVGLRTWKDWGEHPQGEDFIARTVRIGTRLAALPIEDADRVLDEARRILWGNLFQARPAVTIAGPVSEVICELADLPMVPVIEIIETARVTLWRARCPERGTHPDLYRVPVGAPATAWSKPAAQKG